MTESLSNKLWAVKKHLKAKPEKKALPSGPKEKRVQKNLSLTLSDAERLKTLAMRDGLSQAALISAALELYEKLSTKGE